jgi:hypothetical protein
MYIINNRSAILLLIGAILTISLISPIHTAQAETGKGNDIFKVILTVFGVDKSKDDVVAIVTVNNGEASRVKFLEADAPYVTSITSTEGTSNLMEYVATFPNINVDAGAEYKACVMTTKDLELICKTGLNSPAVRPEFIDISLNATAAGIEQVSTEDSDNGDEDNEDEVDEDDDL